MFGRRVRIKQDAEGHCPWPSLPTGTIIPTFSGGLFREMHTPRGVKRFYCVEFDFWQMDDDGDGPCISAEVLDKYIEPI